jgi:Domain of unknown function (DUF397)
MSPHTEIANWRKSSRSVNNGQCVEVGSTATEVGFRDTKQHGLPNEARPVLMFSDRAARKFLTAVRAGEFGSA